MIPRMALRVVDRGWQPLRRAMKEIKQAKSYVKIGVLGDSKPRKEGTFHTNVDVAMVLEFGTRDGKIPPRPFVSGTFQLYRAEWIGMLRGLVPEIYKQRMTINKALALVGQRAAADMKSTIKAGIRPENAPSTIAKKGSDLPLVDTGQLLTSITYAVVMSDSDLAAGHDGGHE